MATGAELSGDRFLSALSAYLTSRHDVALRLLSEVDKEEAASDAATNHSDQIGWDDIYDCFRWRDGQIILMALAGGPSGGWATDATGNLWKRRQPWGIPMEFQVDLQPRTLLIRPASAYHMQARCRPASRSYAIPE